MVSSSNSGPIHKVSDFIGNIYKKRISVSYPSTLIFLSIIAQLNNTKLLLSQIGPIISAIMFIVAGVFYAIGQLMPPQAKAGFHVTAINIIIGAVVVAALSVASTSLATASSHLLTNITTNSTP